MKEKEITQSIVEKAAIAAGVSESAGTLIAKQLDKDGYIVKEKTDEEKKGKAQLRVQPAPDKTPADAAVEAGTPVPQTKGTQK